MRPLRLLPLLVAAACVNGTGPARFCTDQLNSTLGLRILHATTGAREGIGATVIVRRTGFYDSVTVASASQFHDFDYLAFEDKIGGGTYTVTVRKPGFETRNFNAVVNADECHAGPGPHIEVRLVPAP